MPDDEVNEAPELPKVPEAAQPAPPDEETSNVNEAGLPDPPELSAQAVVLAPYEQLQGARSRLNAALGSIDGSDLAITKAEEQVVLLESEMKTAQVNVAFARSEALDYRQSLHDACDETLTAIRLLKAKYPLN